MKTLKLYSELEKLNIRVDKHIPAIYIEIEDPVIKSSFTIYNDDVEKLLTFLQKQMENGAQ